MDDLTNTDFSSLITGSWIATVVSIVLGIACIVACVYLAKKKGHDTAKAFTSGCVFGPFAVAYYLLAGESKTKALGGPAAPAGNSRLSDALLAGPPAPPAEPAPPPPPAIELPPVRCTECGNVNPGEARWCLGCGLNLHYDPSAPIALDTSALKEASAARTKWLVLTIAGIVLLVAAALLFIAKT
jgi:hypothetical protein